MTTPLVNVAKTTANKLSQAQGRRLFVLGLTLLGVLALLIDSIRRVAMHVVDAHPGQIHEDTALILALCVGLGVVIRSAAYLLGPIAAILDRRDFSRALRTPSGSEDEPYAGTNRVDRPDPDLRPPRGR